MGSSEDKLEGEADKAKLAEFRAKADLYERT